MNGSPQPLMTAKSLNQCYTHSDDMGVGRSVLISFTLSCIVASSLARVITDTWLDLNTAADSGSGRTSA